VERYGEETIEKLQKLGQVEMEVRTDGGSKVKFMLTKQVGIIACVYYILSK
jgi:hypothetical protein